MKIQLVTAALLVLASPASALMTVNQMKQIYDQQGVESPVGLAFSQGVFEGLVTLEAARRAEGQQSSEFCRLFDMIDRGETPDPHIATQSMWLIEKWEGQGRNMDAPFAELLLNYMSGTYGCN